MTITVKTRGLVLVEHEFEVPLDHADPRETITVFAREVADPDGRNRPYLVYLQGGPGFEAPRPTRHPTSPSWLDRALSRYRVLMLDQRGTGRSTPIGEHATAAYLKHFRADSIVRDAEVIRAALNVDRWSILGQSFGGFCAMTYLSLAPQSLAAAYITGGVPPLDKTPDEIYAVTYDRMRDLNHRYYERYPHDRDRVRNLTLDTTLANGDPLTRRRLRIAGNNLGLDGGAETLHYLLELPENSPAFRHDLLQSLPFSRNPLYAVIHEACYANATATRWAADRVMPQDFRDDVTLFTGEHVFPWMLDEYAALRPLKEAANELAGYEWPALYDPEVLARNEVPVAASVYADDPFVTAGFSMETVARVRGMRAWLTNEYLHNGLRVDGDRVLGHLMDLVDGR